MDHTRGRTGISVVSSDQTVHIRDHLENRRVRIDTDRSVSIKSAISDLFVMPVDRAVSFEAGLVHIPTHSKTVLRTEQGEFIETVAAGTRYPSDSYVFDVTAPIQLALRVEDTGFVITGRPDDNSITIDFDEPTVVTVGVKSRHTRPNATITVPDRPAAAMTAVSVLGSSITNFTAERSWPALRNHPPRIRRGERLQVPDAVQQPQTGIRITIPETYAALYRITPLAFYLGATIEPGETAAVHLENGYSEPLRTSKLSLASKVEDLLKRCLLLDSLVRTDGYRPSDRYEYEQLGPELPFYPPNLAGSTLSAQLMEYLEVDRSILEPQYPNWSTRAVLRPSYDDIELLPYLAHTLSPIDVEETTRGEPRGWAGLRENRCAACGGGISLADTSPGRIARLTPNSYENAFDNSPAAAGELSVALVTDSSLRARRWRHALTIEQTEGPSRKGALETISEPRLLSETGTNAEFGSMDDPQPSTVGGSAGKEPLNEADESRRHPVNVPSVSSRVAIDPSITFGEWYHGPGAIDEIYIPSEPRRESLRRLFEGRADLVYIDGTLEDDGIRCHDGVLNLDSLRAVRTRFVMFETGQSLDAVEPLIDAGAVAGTVIDERVDTDRLRQFLEALAIGVPLGASVELVWEDPANSLRVVGDPGFQLAHGTNREPPVLIDFEPSGPEGHELATRDVVSVSARLGGERTLNQHWADGQSHLLGSHRNDHRPVSTRELIADTELENAGLCTPDGFIADGTEFGETDMRRSVRRSIWETATLDLLES